MYIRIFFFFFFVKQFSLEVEIDYIARIYTKTFVCLSSDVGGLYAKNR